MGKLIATASVIVILAGCTSTTVKSDSGQEVSDQRAAAADVCETFVKRQNSFGASLRSPYVCTVSHASGSNWTLDNLDLQEAGG